MKHKTHRTTRTSHLEHPVLISGIQPTGRLHLGNYLGALKNFVALQNSKKYRCCFFIADLHSLTEQFEPRTKSHQILELAADFLALGLNPKQSVIFLQSAIPAHSELAWIFTALSPLGELERMTQFKDKARVEGYLEHAQTFLRKIFEWADGQKVIAQLPEQSPTELRDLKIEEKHFKEIHDEYLTLLSIVKYDPASDASRSFAETVTKRAVANAGLLTYPALMAADIVLYDAKFVPVGEDQLQHLELARTLVRKFNSRFGKTFVEPQPLLTKAPRVMSLADPTRKMSKSEPKGCLFIDDSPETIKQKIQSAVTDSGTEVKYDEKEKPGLSNLLTIYASLTDQTIEKLEKQYAGKSYAEFKKELAATIAGHFAEFRKKKAALKAKNSQLKAVLAAGSRIAAKVANKKIAEAKKKVGVTL